MVDTKVESYKKVDTNKRRTQILEVLKKYPKGLSAKEVAIELYKKGEIPTSERNFTAPRITELISLGKVEVAGLTWDELTQRNVRTFKLKEAAK